MNRRTALKALLALPFAPRILAPRVNYWRWPNDIRWMGTETGRFTSRGPTNLENVPRTYGTINLTQWKTVTVRLTDADGRGYFRSFNP